MDLHPQGTRAPLPPATSRRPESVRGEVSRRIARVPKATASALPQEVAQGVGERQADEGAPGVRVLVGVRSPGSGRARATLGPDGHVAGLGFQRGEGPYAVGRVVVGETGEPEEPLHDAAGRRLPALEEEGAVGDRVRHGPWIGEDGVVSAMWQVDDPMINARSPAPMAPRLDHPGVGVDPAWATSVAGARPAASATARSSGPTTDPRADRRGHLSGSLREAGRLQDVERPPPEGVRTVPLGGRVVETGRPLPRQPVRQEIRRLDEPRA